MKYAKTAISLVVASLTSLTFADVIEAKLDTDKKYQTIENFTAADAWSGNFVGKFFSEDQKGKLAKWLFSQKFGED